MPKIHVASVPYSGSIDILACRPLFGHAHVAVIMQHFPAELHIQDLFGQHRSLAYLDKITEAIQSFMGAGRLPDSIESIHWLFTSYVIKSLQSTSLCSHYHMGNAAIALDKIQLYNALNYFSIK